MREDKGCEEKRREDGRREDKRMVDLEGLLGVKTEQGHEVSVFWGHKAIRNPFFGAILGPSWGPLGAVLALGSPSWGVLGPSGAV